MEADNLKKFTIALSSMRKEYDDVEKITWYYDKTTHRYTNTNNVYLYFGKPNVGNPVLRFRIQYAGDDWLFIQKYIFSIDGKTFELNPSETERDNNSEVWEWSDEAAGMKALEIVAAIIDSKEAKIRYVGKQYFKDRILTNTEKSALKNVFEAFSGLVNS